MERTPVGFVNFSSTTKLVELFEYIQCKVSHEFDKELF
jgi:hypothetical protein